LPYQGRDWEFDDSRLTAAEARLQKRLCGGSSPSIAGASRFELDPDAVVAALVIARKRAGLPLEEAASIDDDALDLTAVAEATEKAAKAAHTPVAEEEVVETATDLAVPLDVAEDVVRAKRASKAKTAD
jgi:hypothetical protein